MDVEDPVRRYTHAASKESRGPTEEIDEDKRPIVVSPTKGREMVSLEGKWDDRPKAKEMECHVMDSRDEICNPF